VHMLSNSAFNALLKTLEEPPPHIKFIFATTEPHKVPITILSRCQRFDFKRISMAMIFDRLRFILEQEKVSMNDAALTMIARKGDGSMRDALSALDQVLAFCGDAVEDADVTALLGVVDRALLFSAVTSIFERDSAALVGVVKRVDDCGCNMRHFCQELIDIMRTLLIVKTVPTASDLLDLSEKELEEGKALAAKVDLQTVQRCISILLKTDTDMAHSSFNRLLMEMAMIKMATLVPALPVNELLERLKSLEAAPPRAVYSAEPGAPRYAVEPKPAVAATAPRMNAAPTRESEPLPAPAGVRDWQGFVAFVKQKKPMLGTKLEKASPIQASGDALQIGFARGSLELSLLQEADYRQQLAELSKSYYGQPVEIKIIPLSADNVDTPLSIAEKKNLECAMKEKAIKDAADGHPLVKAALEIFGGEVVAYKN